MHPWKHIFRAIFRLTFGEALLEAKSSSVIYTSFFNMLPPGTEKSPITLVFSENLHNDVSYVL